MPDSKVYTELLQKYGFTSSEQFDAEFLKLNPETGKQYALLPAIKFMSLVVPNPGYAGYRIMLCADEKVYYSAMHSSLDGLTLEPTAWCTLEEIRQNGFYH